MKHKNLLLLLTNLLILVILLVSFTACIDVTLHCPQDGVPVVEPTTPPVVTPTPVEKMTVAEFCEAGGKPPKRLDVVKAMILKFPDKFKRCSRTNSDFVREVMKELRKTDRMWGLNYVRGKVGDTNGDVIGYYYGPGTPIEASPYNAIVDIVVACGDAGKQKAAWQSKANENCLNPTGVKWTLGE